MDRSNTRTTNGHPISIYLRLGCGLSGPGTMVRLTTGQAHQYGGLSTLITHPFQLAVPIRIAWQNKNHHPSKATKHTTLAGQPSDSLKYVLLQPSYWHFSTSNREAKYTFIHQGVGPALIISGRRSPSCKNSSIISTSLTSKS